MFTADQELEVAERLLTHLRDGTTDTAEEGTDLRLPAWHYFDPDHAAREREVFMRRPLLAAVSSSIPAPGDFLTLELVGVPVLLVRQEDGTVAGLRNICRHRGARVETEATGTKRVFACKYHGWSYDRDGACRNIPYQEGFSSVDRACSGLLRVGTAEQDGLIWVILGSDTVPDVSSWLGPEISGLIRSCGLTHWDVYIDESYTVPANWKLIADGLLDILHPKFLHPESVGRLIQTNTHTWDRYGHHGRLAMARRKLDKIRDDVPEGTDLRQYVITNFVIYPNMMLVTQPDHFELWSVFPDGTSPTRSRTSIRFLVPGGGLSDEARAKLDQQWEILKNAVFTEDWPMAESIQQGARAVPIEGFDYIYGKNETPLQHLHRRLAEDIAAAARPVPLADNVVTIR
jgi:phenylpropionate dioxygenase-like ring-hydroxylating dioxygenase large terminal subunit